MRREGAAVVADIPSILITDDDCDFRETLQSVFEPRGFRTLTASDGDEAVDLLRSGETVHLALFDMHMPRLTGLEAIRLLKQFRSRLPCILLSAEADEQLVEQAKQAEAFDVLKKPVTRQTIITVVRTAFETSYDPSLWRSVLGT
jgi:CheY-like chemotaxis protein